MRISINDFLKIESLNLDLQVPINIIVGENEAGKSSIRDALRWCLTGECDVKSYK
jgi:predicted ATP-dependent endonuclease of OLD family